MSDDLFRKRTGILHWERGFDQGYTSINARINNLTENKNLDMNWSDATRCCEVIKYYRAKYCDKKEKTFSPDYMR